MASVKKFRYLIKGLRFFRPDINITKTWKQWKQSYMCRFYDNAYRQRWHVSRWRREFYLRGVVNYVRQAFCRPGRSTLMLSATGAYSANCDDSSQTISDDELEKLLSELDCVDKLSKNTLFCVNCSKRLLIGSKVPDIVYCSCGVGEPKVVADESQGWTPYMETPDHIIWRTQYKGEGLYAYKVYGRYKEVKACDFTMVQLDTAYRRKWDSAVAALRVVETDSDGVKGQTLIHWEVLWPRLFANRDYVYLRRHREYAVPYHEMKTSPLGPLPKETQQKPTVKTKNQKNNSTNAKRVENVKDTSEQEQKFGSEVKKGKDEENEGFFGSLFHQDSKKRSKKSQVFVIISKAAKHPKVPESKSVVRVSEYWSTMVVRNLGDDEKPGMEFVLTYYDEPAVGGMPSGVAAWATGRAAPDYLVKMRQAATVYHDWKKSNPKQDETFVKFEPIVKEETAECKEVVRETGMLMRKLREGEREAANQGRDGKGNVKPIKTGLKENEAYAFKAEDLNIENSTSKEVDDLKKEIEEAADKKGEELKKEIEVSTSKEVGVLKKKIDDATGKEVADLKRKIEEAIGTKVEELRKEIEDATGTKFIELKKKIEDATGKEVDELKKKIEDAISKEVAKFKKKMEKATYPKIEDLDKEVKEIGGACEEVGYRKDSKNIESIVKAFTDGGISMRESITPRNGVIKTVDVTEHNAKEIKNDTVTQQSHTGTVSTNEVAKDTTKEAVTRDPETREPEQNKEVTHKSATVFTETIQERKEDENIQESAKAAGDKELEVKSTKEILDEAKEVSATLKVGDDVFNKGSEELRNREETVIEDGDKPTEEETWWRYFHPYYYFV